MVHGVCGVVRGTWCGAWCGVVYWCGAVYACGGAWCMVYVVWCVVRGVVHGAVWCGEVSNALGLAQAA